jgi:AraC-like DNA-binding protein
VHAEGCRGGESTRLLVNAADNPFIAQFQTSIAVHHLREETNGALRVSHVSLVDPPDDSRDLERLLGVRVHAPAAWNGVEFPRAATRLPLRRRDPCCDASRGTRGERRSATIALTRVDRRAVRSVVVTRLARGLPDVDAVARHLAIAPRTLQRRLAAEGVSYQQVVDDVRRDAAERLLADPSLAVSQIGYLLGFSEPSAFHRAFKRWHDVTPQEYRQRRSVPSDAELLAARRKTSGISPLRRRGRSTHVHEYTRPTRGGHHMKSFGRIQRGAIAGALAIAAITRSARREAVRSATPCWSRSAIPSSVSCRRSPSSIAS